MSTPRTQPEAVLPIADLPKGLRKTYAQFVAAIDHGELKKARKLVGILLQHYIDTEKEVPTEFSISYSRLYLKELAATRPK